MPIAAQALKMYAYARLPWPGTENGTKCLMQLEEIQAIGKDEFGVLNSLGRGKKCLTGNVSVEDSFTVMAVLCIRWLGFVTQWLPDGRCSGLIEVKSITLGNV